MKVILTVFLVFLMSNFSAYAQEFYYKNHQKVSLARVDRPIQRNNPAITYYKNKQGDILGVTNQIIIKIRDESQIGIYVQEFNLTVEKKLSKTLYLVKVPDKNMTLKTANALSLKEGIVYTHPDFVKTRVAR